MLPPHLLRVMLPVVALALLSCVTPTIEILSPENRRATSFEFEIRFRINGATVPGSLSVELNGTDITDRFGAGPGPEFTAAMVPGAPLRRRNTLRIEALPVGGGPALVRESEFKYAPSGAASVKRITHESQLIRGPLAHSQLGDWLISNGEARFIVQDVAQRELYSVGQYGGNLIDAELVGNPGKDNFLETTTSLNIESVVNPQTVTVVNDGQDGTPAILRTCGPDDSLDFVNPSSQVSDAGFSFPPLADDLDLEIEACTSFILAAGDRHLRMDTEVFNNQTPGNIPPQAPADGTLRLAVGDWLNPAGELDTLALPESVKLVEEPANGVGPPTASSFSSLGFSGFDEGFGTDYALTKLPFEPPLATGQGTFVLVSGVIIVLHSESALLALLGTPPRFEIPMGESRVFSRLFGVGDGSGATAGNLLNLAAGTDDGRVEGCVMSGGQPVAGATVTVGRPLATGLPAANPGADKLAQHLKTLPGACPNFSGLVAPGTYDAVAGREGHLYEGGAATPPLREIVVPAGGTAVVDFDLPEAGRLEVTVRDENDLPIPARVTVVGFDPSPEFTSAGPVLPGFGGGRLGLLNDVDDALPFGVAAAGYADFTGAVGFDLEPGTGLYHVYVSRGTEYSVFRTAAPIDVAGGQVTSVDATLARVLDTPGFISSDFHVHGIRSPDSRVSDTHRIEAYSSEGVENVVMTDHTVHTDLRPAIQAAGMANFVTATIGEEITSFDYGHFNAYPFVLDPDSPHRTEDANGTQLSGGSTDWARAEPPGLDFRIPHGALNSTPAEIFALATQGASSVPGVTTIQINHIDSHFGPLRIDTSQVPPQDGLSDAQRAARRLPDTTAVPNLFFPFPALELWNGNSAGSQSRFLDRRIGVWFNHLNQGLRTTFIADSDSHRFTNLNSAAARTWTASPTDQPAAIDSNDVAAAVTAGRAVGGQGVYVQTRLVARNGSEVASLALGDPTTMTDPGGDVTLEIDIQAPGWAGFDRVEIYANAATVSAGGFDFGAVPTLVLEEGDCDPSTSGGDFDVVREVDRFGVPGADRLRASLAVDFDGLDTPTWFVVVVKGTPGQCEPMFPVYPASLSQGSNSSLADLVDGNLGEGGTMALGATNALYFEP